MKASLQLLTRPVVFSSLRIHIKRASSGSAGTVALSRLERPARGLARIGNLARLVLRDSSLAIATLLLGTLVILAVVGPIVWSKDPLALDVGASLEPPSFEHPMGTDSVGRDIFARFNEGARISLTIGLIVIVAGALVGGTIGLLSAVAGGVADHALMRIMDAVLAFPPLILAMAITVSLGVGLETAAVGVMITTVPYYARVIRSDVLHIRTEPFIESAEALGASHMRIVARHIVPHTISTLSIQAAAVFGYAILSLAALGFVGLGAQIPTAEWGAMITDGLQYTLTGQWWIGFFPGVGVLMAVTGAGIIADRARDILDPRGDYAYV